MRYRCLHKKRPHRNIAIYSDMRSDPQKTSRNAYRYISSYHNVGVFYADTGVCENNDHRQKERRTGVCKKRPLFNITIYSDIKKTL